MFIMGPGDRKGKGPVESGTIEIPLKASDRFSLRPWSKKYKMSAHSALTRSQGRAIPDNNVRGGRHDKG